MQPICKKHPMDHCSRLSCAAALLALTTSCASSLTTAAPKVRVEDLENAPAVEPILANRSIVSESPLLDRMCTPLGPRLGLIQVRRPAEWDALQHAAPDIGPCPDLVHGSVVGVFCRAGLPLNGAWPVELENVRMTEGAGLVRANFEGGSYLPDGTTYLEWTYVAGLNTVLVVEVNGLRFFSE